MPAAGHFSQRHLDDYKIPSRKVHGDRRHVGLLELVPAKSRFLEFGNQREVAESWLRKYGILIANIEFYFLSNDGKLELLSIK